MRRVLGLGDGDEVILRRGIDHCRLLSPLGQDVIHLVLLLSLLDHHLDLHHLLWLEPFVLFALVVHHHHLHHLHIVRLHLALFLVLQHLDLVLQLRYLETLLVRLVGWFLTA